MKPQTQEIQLFDSYGAPIRFSNAKTLVDPDTGEQVTMTPIHRPYYGKKHFWKVYFADFLAMLGFLDSKQVEVMVYILMHTSPYNNQFIGTQKKIADECGCSLPTVRRTLRKMVDANLITKTDVDSVYMVNPNILVQGSEAKKMGLMIRYVESTDRDVIAEAAEMNALPDTIQPEPIQTPAEVLNAEDNGR